MIRGKPLRPIAIAACEKDSGLIALAQFLKNELADDLSAQCRP